MQSEVKYFDGRFFLAITSSLHETIVAPEERAEECNRATDLCPERPLLREINSAQLAKLDVRNHRAGIGDGLDLTRNRRCEFACREDCREERSEVHRLKPITSRKRRTRPAWLAPEAERVCLQ